MVRSCKKLRNYKARTKNGKKYVRRGFYCKSCNKKITRLAYETFEGECWHCTTKGF